MASQNEGTEMTDESTAHHAVEIDDGSFWDKLASAAGKAGREVIETGLKLYYALRDPNTPLWAKSVIVGALGYFINPIDAIPDVMVAVGYTDDAGVLVAALAAIAAHIKPEHAEKARDWVSRNFGSES